MREVFVPIGSCEVGSIVRLFGSSEECEVIALYPDFVSVRALGTLFVDDILNVRDCIKLC